jgi:hypothetical protein
VIARRIESLDVIVDRSEVARLLGYPPGPLPGRVVEMVAEAERQAPLLVRPAGIFALLDGVAPDRSPFLSGVGRLALALVTIGDGVERAVAHYREQGLLAPALIFDAFGSAAAEAAAEAAEALVRDAVAGDGLRCSRRFSPGYGGWDVAEQRWIIEALDAGSVGVSLTAGCMMTPRKSVTFAMTVGTNPVELYDDDICDACGAPDCEWRGSPGRCHWRPTP